MGGIGDTFSNISFFLLLGGAYTLYQVYVHRREFWDDELTGRDRQLAGGVAFFALVPVAVLLHEFGHILAAWSTGSQVLGLHYFFYWGYVQYIPASQSPLLDWYVALAGNFVSYLVGVLCIAAALRLSQLKGVVRVMLVQIGILEVVQTLIAYPLMSLDPSFHGDWDSIYSFEAPAASWATLLVHMLSIVGFIVLVRRNKTVTYLSGAPS